MVTIAHGAVTTLICTNLLSEVEEEEIFLGTDSFMNTFGI